MDQQKEINPLHAAKENNLLHAAATIELDTKRK